MRIERKNEHIENYLKTLYTGDTLFSNIFIEHNALPELSMDDIDTSIEIFGKKASHPFMINAITGGGEISTDINGDLARLAKEFNIPMAVGSQKVALDVEEARESFMIIREILGEDNIVIGNLSARESLEEVQRAGDMINVDAMQLHLNTLQELVMCEGDRDFRGQLSNIENIVNNYQKPIIVKETGAGISKEVAQRLYNKGVRYIDISGSGGTNFVEIENIRRFDMDFSDLYGWGIPTAKSIIECRTLPEDLHIIGSGGIKTGKDIVKAIILGSDLVGISGEILSYLMHGGYQGAKEYLENLIYKLKMIMLLLGKKNISQLKETDYKVFGKLKDIL